MDKLTQAQYPAFQLVQAIPVRKELADNKEITADPPGEVFTKTPQDCTSKQEAMKDLIRAENDLKDAQSDFQLIKSNLKGDETVKDATYQFLRLLSLQGNGFTSRVQGQHVMIGDSLKPGETRDNATSQLMSIIKDGKSKEVRTGDYESAYKSIDGFAKDGKDRADLTGKYLRILALENDMPDTTSDFAVMMGKRRKDENVESMNNSFLELLKQEGNGATADIQAHYKMIGDSLKPGEDRGTATNQFLRLLSYEAGGSKWIERNAVSNAVSDYLTLDKYVTDKENRTQATDQFLDLLRSAGGPGYSAEAQKMFKMIHD